ncbi:MAG TPA: helix-turn-helix domain-containing protein [Chloroflexota bacterium]|nr:helix-turn-helix domain-containing protein [Chloroflexota bacterium]
MMDTLWGTDYVAESSVADRQIRDLPARLQNDWRRPRLVATVPGQGYQSLPTLAEAPAAGSTPEPSGELVGRRRRRTEARACPR